MVAGNQMNTKRRRFQFSIRTMLIAFLVVALMLGLARDYGWKLAWRLGCVIHVVRFTHPYFAAASVSILIQGPMYCP